MNHSDLGVREPAVLSMDCALCPSSRSLTGSPLPRPSVCFFVNQLDLHYPSFPKVLSIGLWRRFSHPRSFFRVQCVVSSCGGSCPPYICGVPPGYQVYVTEQGPFNP